MTNEWVPTEEYVTTLTRIYAVMDADVLEKNHDYVTRVHNEGPCWVTAAHLCAIARAMCLHNEVESALNNA